MRDAPTRLRALILFTIFCLALLGTGTASYAVGRKSRRAAAGVFAVLLVLIVAKPVLAAFPHWEWWLFPWADYAYVQPLVLWVLAVGFLGVAAARLPIRWNRIVVLGTGLGLATFGAIENRWLAWPPEHGQEVFADASHHLRQSTHYTCGPTACVAAVSHCGVRISEREMARRCLTRGQGTRLFDLYRGLVVTLAGTPFQVSIEQVDTGALLVPGTIAVVANAGNGHALCIVGKGAVALVHDPLRREPVSWDRSELGRNYRGPAVLVREQPAIGLHPRTPRAERTRADAPDLRTQR